MARPTSELTRGDFLRIVTAQKTNFARVNESRLLGSLPHLKKDVPFIRNTEDEILDDITWLEGTGLELYGSSGQNKEDVLVGDISTYGIPIEKREKIQLQTGATLHKFVRNRIDKLPGLRSFSTYLGEDLEIDKGLQAYSYATPNKGEGVQEFKKPVRVIYAVAPRQNMSNGIAGITRMRVSGDGQIDYAIIIRLNPLGVYFKDQVEFRNWIQAVYAHEMMHVRQKELRWEELIKQHLISRTNPNLRQIYEALDSDAFTLADEAQAYWAGMLYAQVIQPSWFDSTSPPNFTGLKNPFLQLQKLGFDPLINGERISSTSPYDEQTLNNLWLYTTYFNLNYDGLILSSRVNPDHVPMMEKCHLIGLITDSQYDKYLTDVGQVQGAMYKTKEVLRANPIPTTSIGALALIGFMAGAIAFRMKRRG